MTATAASDAACITSPPEPASDLDLAVATRTADQQTADTAFAELFRRHHAAVLRYARGRCSQAAEDLTADAFLATYRALRAGRGPTTGIRSYLCVSIRNGAAHYIDKERPLVPVDDFERVRPESTVTGTADPADVLLTRLESDRIAVAFRHLPHRWRAVLKLTAHDGWQPQDLAKTFDLTPNAVAALANRARRAFRASYHDVVAEDPGDIKQHFRTCTACAA